MSALVRGLIAALVLLGAVSAPAKPAAPTQASIQASARAGWLYAGSDIPADPAWRLGVLPNGLRYAIRCNAVPDGAVSVRIRIGAGALEERPDERGYAHFLEHMLFRGTANVPDGEGIRIWQRLGANFGADTNAATTLSQTVYSLDLPRADTGSIDTALSVLSEMMRSATLAPAAIAVERKVVLAERDARLPPLARKYQEIIRPLLYAGLRAETAEVGGTEATLSAATAERLRAFYDRWYRPERAVLVIVGDVDQATLEKLAAKHFGGWTGRGPAPAEPDYGAPTVPQKMSAVLTDPQAPNGLSLTWVHAHDDRSWTRARQQATYAREVAMRILGRRLVQKVRAGAGFISAGGGISETRHVADFTQVSVAPRDRSWSTALDDLYGILAGMVAAPPTKAEIAREIAVVDDGFEARIASVATTRSPAFATLMVNAVDEGDVVADPAVYRAIFTAAKPLMTPEKLGATLRELVAGDPRALLTAPAPVAGGEAAFAQALTRAKTIKATARAADRTVSFADLAPVAAPGKILSRIPLPDLGATRVRFANGLTLLVKRTTFDKDRVFVSAGVGGGLTALDPTRSSPSWTQGAIVQGGAGPFDADALERLIAGRRIALGMGMDDRSFDYGATTNQANLVDQLRLIAAAIAEPRFDAGALARLTDQFAQNHDAVLATPGGVLATQAPLLLHRGDQRWAYPTRAEVRAVTPDIFRSFWTPLLAPGARKLLIVGDVDVEAAIRAVATTLGAAPERPQPAITPDRLAVLPPEPRREPVVFRHRGDPAQGIAMIAWPTTGALDDLPGARALAVAATIFQTRLFDRFREAEGGSYSPSAASSQSVDYPKYGLFTVTSQLRVDRIADFERAVREIATDLATKPPTADEVARAVTPIVSGNQRALRTNAYWLGALDADIDDPRVREQQKTLISGYHAVNPAAVRAAAAKWLANSPALRIHVLGPEQR